ncbi:class A beta-lactamase [Nonomuraea aridisoli]|uniref:Beta-lactamase n=1 Tax=Nonomuraea aridisoli TaxID=2070368 RepID=A0A2W2F3N9_9ACTN|nr:class A beta-lactamase [Nonomuraea aridisoli]PZG16147.1 class A beta-lactamase [Nonomuraea aridisoli]
MRDLRARRRTAALEAAVLTISLLTGGAVAASPAAAAPAAVQDVQAAPSGVARAKKELRDLEKSLGVRVGAYAIDTATGRTIGYRSGERFALASTFKAIAAAAVLHKARTSEPGLMDKVVKWTADEVKPNSPITEKHVEDGLTVAQLCHAAITRSDNTAGNMLLKQLGGPAGLTRYFRTLKDPVSRLDRWETELNDWSPKDKRDTTTPAAIARDLRLLTAGDALSAKDRERLNGWLLANTTGGARIRAGLPASWTVGDKTGTGGTYGTANDIAVAWPKKGAAPVIMAIYTNGRTPGAAAQDKALADTATILARGLGRL